MKMYIVGVFDRKAQAFMEMSATPALGVAARQFTEAVNKPSESPLYKWPEDFELYELGTWDTETGMPTYRMENINHNDTIYSKKLIMQGEMAKIRETNGRLT